VTLELAAPVRRRCHTAAVLWVVVPVVLAAAWAHTYLWAGGDRTFVTHPVSVLALGAAAVWVSCLARRTPAPVRRPMQALGGSLAAYLVLGAWATAAPSQGSAGAWSVAWLLPNVLLATLGLALAGLPRIGWALAAATVPLALAGALLVSPAVPFEALATASPNGWKVTASGLVDTLLVVWNVGLLAALVAVALRARRASIVDRTHLARAAAVTSTAPALVVTCLALAVLRDPGQVDPATGSIAYLATVAGTAALATWAASADGRWAVRAVAAQWAASVVLIGGVALADLGGVALGVLLVAGLTLVVVGTTGWGVSRFEQWSAVPAPRPVVSPVPRLSPRENDVLAGVATGRTNAGIAADLFLSERTVEQHLRSIFDKLDLGDHGETNRRVRAAALWWQHQPVRAELARPS
jgi:DNA-binding CsgD family transcriptional regulator